MDNQSQSSLGTSQLDETLNALQGGLAAAAGAAGPNIAGWIKTLQGNPQLAGISSELQNLHDALSSGASDTGALASSLDKITLIKFKLLKPLLDMQFDLRMARSLYHGQQ